MGYFRSYPYHFESFILARAHAKLPCPKTNVLFLPNPTLILMELKWPQQFVEWDQKLGSPGFWSFFFGELHNAFLTLFCNLYRVFGVKRCV